MLTGSGDFTGDNNPSTFTIDSTSTYNDGATSNSLSLSGFGTITGGTGNDYFTIVVPGSDTVATLGTLDGGAGTNTLDATNINQVLQIADGYNYTNFQIVLTGGTFYGPNTNSTYEWNGTDWLLNGNSIGTPTTIEGGTADDTFIVDARHHDLNQPVRQRGRRHVHHRQPAPRPPASWMAAPAPIPSTLPGVSR